MAAEVLGRDVELAALREFLDRVPEGPSALVLEGEPGIGKTTLWSETLAQARKRSYRVLSARPSQAEAVLPYAGLIELLEGVLDEMLPALAPRNGGRSRRPCCEPSRRAHRRTRLRYPLPCSQSCERSPARVRPSSQSMTFSGSMLPRPAFLPSPCAASSRSPWPWLSRGEERVTLTRSNV
jgi:Cdc6-like AAA superfamily ATPase